MYKKRGEEKEYKGFFGKNKSLVAATTLIGTIVGAGILGIPYVIAKTGFLYGLILLLILGLAFLFLFLFAGEIVLRTKKQYQLTGYAEKYLGKVGKGIMAFALLFSIYGALTAYLIGEGAILHSVFKVGSPLLYLFVFFIVSVGIISRGMKSTGKAEFFLISFLLIVVVLIGIFSWGEIDLQNLATLNLAQIFISYGVILFAYSGLAAIPELKEVLGSEDRKLMKKSIIIGSIIPIVLYIVFTFFIIGIVGLDQFELLQPNERIATIALSIYSQPILGIFANILAILAMFTSFLALGLALVGVYEYDYNFSRRTAFVLTFSLPLFVATLNLTTFITVLGVSGALAVGLQGILIVLMYWKAKKKGDRKPEYSLPKYKTLGFIFIIMFSLGILYHLLAQLGIL